METTVNINVDTHQSIFHDADLFITFEIMWGNDVCMN